MKKELTLDELVVKAQTDDAMRDEVIERLKEKIRITAWVNTKKYPSQSFEEWESELYFRLLSAIKKFDPKKAKFNSYVQTIFSYPMDRKKGKKHDIKSVGEVAMDYYEANKSEDFERTIEAKEVWREAERILRAYNPIWWHILQDHMSGESIAALARKHNTTSWNIEHRIKRSLWIIKGRLKSD